jgi:hypothetical protein
MSAANTCGSIHLSLAPYLIAIVVQSFVHLLNNGKLTVRNILFCRDFLVTLKWNKNVIPIELRAHICPERQPEIFEIGARFLTDKDTLILVCT